MSTVCTPNKRFAAGSGSEISFPTPVASTSFSRELRQVLQERNMLTAKTRNKVCSMLNNSPGLYARQVTPIYNAERDKCKNFRLRAIEEILSSEKTYLGQLELLVKFFVQPLKEEAVIDDASHYALFGQIEMIYNLNREFLLELEANLENVAPAFLKMAPFFKLYSVYAFDYRNALLIIQELTSKNPVFRKFLDRAESHPEVMRKLNSLMIVPIQRVPRYKLLLEQVLLYTSPSNKDYRLLKESVKQIENTVSHINSCIEDQEVTQMLINLQNSLLHRTPNIVKPSRKVIKEGVLQKVTRTGNEIRRYCVLMSDIFMYCKILKDRAPNTVVENSLECCCIFPLKKCKVYELFPGNFKVTCQGDGIIFGTSDMQLSRAWVGFIRDAVELHVQCRKTLRKESSKRTPIRKKDMKKFDIDYVLSPNKKRCEYETVFRNKNRSSDEEDLSDAESTINCFSRKKRAKLPETNKESSYFNMPERRKPIKRPAPPPPPPPPTMTTQGILKRTNDATPAMPPQPVHDPSYGFASRFCVNKSYVRNHHMDNSGTDALERKDTAASNGLNPCDGNGNFRDILYPLRSSGGSNKSGKSSHSAGWSMPEPVTETEDLLGGALAMQKKRVKFDVSQYATNYTAKQPAYVFPSHVGAHSNGTLRERIYKFFANLF